MSTTTAPTAPLRAPTWTRPRVAKLIGRVLLYAILIVGALIISLPWFWMIMSALKTNVELHSVPLTIFPAVPQFHNFWNAFFFQRGAYNDTELVQVSSQSVWLRFFLNTVVIAAFTLVGTLTSNSLVAFSFARLRWPGRNLLFFFVLTTMMLPAQVTIIPQYIVFAKYFGWVDTWYPQIVPAFFASAWAIFLLRQFMMSIPVEIDEAARLDGCGDFDLYWRVILPLAKPALAAIAIFTFTYVWNDLFTPLLYVRDSELYNVAIGLNDMRSAYSWGNPRFPRDELVMAASAIVTLPLVALFFTFQRQFIQGVVITGVKG
jgi:ABC-type glycerol-3-phosphate transport system permease component